MFTETCPRYFTAKQGGRGLGLAVVYSIIRKHDGYFQGEPKVGFGEMIKRAAP